jgi:hypothetical protein
VAAFAALYQEHSEPLGLALRNHYRAFGDRVYDRVNRHQVELNANQPGAASRILDDELRACDICSTVILGDPTVALPFLRRQAESPVVKRDG